MPTKTKPVLFTRRETALLADVPLHTVDKAIEEKVVKAHRRKRSATLIEGDDVIAIALIAMAGLPLARPAKRRIRAWVREERPYAAKGTPELPLGNLVVLRVDDHVRLTAERLERYGTARERFIDSDPAVMSGEPVIAGTRLPVRAVAERIGRGDSLEELKREYPEISPEAFEAALIYARSHPRRGRPARPWREP
jgi:uncharacterized protein (DUF433 family)